jgi:hypothetical protein
LEQKEQKKHRILVSIGGTRMTIPSSLTPAKRKRLLKTFGACPAGSTPKELEQLLDLLYGMFSHAYTLAEIR